MNQLTPELINQQLVDLACQKNSALDLAEVGLLLAAKSRPQIKLDAYRRHLSKLVRDVKEFASVADGHAPTLDLQRLALTEIICKRHGYGTDRTSFADPNGCNLSRVIDCRSGNPVIITLLYFYILTHNGWQATVIDFKPHLFIRLELNGERLLINPAFGGKTLQAADLRSLVKATTGLGHELAWDQLNTLTAGQLVARLQQTISACWLHQNNPQQALEALLSALLIFPKSDELWRETGLLQSSLGLKQDAVQSLEKWHHLTDDINRHSETLTILRRLQTLNL